MVASRQNQPAATPQEQPAATPQEQPPANVQDQPAGNETTIYVLGQLNMQGQKISVGAVAGKDVIVKLDKPAKLGNALTIGAWLNESWATKVDALVVEEDGKVVPVNEVTPEKLKAHLAKQGLPDQITNFLSELILSNIWVTDLDIRSSQKSINGKDVRTNAFKFGICIEFKNEQSAGLTLLPNIKLEQAALGIINAPKNFDFAKEPEMALPKFTILPEAEIKKIEAEPQGG